MIVNMFVCLKHILFGLMIHSKMAAQIAFSCYTSGTMKGHGVTAVPIVNNVNLVYDTLTFT